METDGQGFPAELMPGCGTWQAALREAAHERGSVLFAENAGDKHQC